MWGNPLAWLGALGVLIPAYVRASRRLGIRSEAGVGGVRDHVVLEGPIDGSVVIDAVVSVPDLGPDADDALTVSEPVESGVGAR